MGRDTILQDTITLRDTTPRDTTLRDTNNRDIAHGVMYRGDIGDILGLGDFGGVGASQTCGGETYRQYPTRVIRHPAWQVSDGVPNGI